MESKDSYNKIEKDAPHDKVEWFEIYAHIRFNRTGEVRVYKTDGLWDDDNDRMSTYIWEEGNFSCDCNRHLFFARAANTEAGGSSCGEKDYSVNLYNPKNNECIYKEFD